MTDSSGHDPAQAPAVPPAWHPDPFGRFELRYYDGTAWTEHVSTHGQQHVDPPVQSPQTPPAAPQGAPQAVVAAPSGADEFLSGKDPVQQAAAAGSSWQGGGHLLNEPVLVVSQKAQIFEVNQEYSIRSQTGETIGYVSQVGQSTAKKAMRVLTNLDQYMTHHLDVLDANRGFVMRITRPAKVMKSKVILQDANQNEIGMVRQKNAIGKINFELSAGGHVYGEIKGENWRAWNFRVEDSTGEEVARITKSWEGLMKTMFTTADNYVVQIHKPLEDPLRALVVASSLSVDLALKQDSRGFS